MNTSEKLCLQWNDFKVNATSSFANLREDKDLTDVTLASEDGIQVQAHKVILAASSPFFMEVLKKNKHPHPLIYMKGSKSNDLVAMLDFLYYGEANIQQENLDSFLALAEELRLKGLTGAEYSGEVPDQILKTELGNRNRSNPKGNAQARTTVPIGEFKMPLNLDTAVAVPEKQESADLQNLDAQVRGMMTITDVRSADGRGFVASCNVCGKQTSSRNMRTHIEGYHINGISHTCDLCGKVSRSREATRKHKIRHHNSLLQD